MKADIDSAVASLTIAQGGDMAIDVNTGNELADIGIKVLVPLITGLIVPSIREWFKRRRERREARRALRS